MAESAPLYVLAFLCGNIVLTEWLTRHTFLRHFGSALLVILVTAASANLGLLPAGPGSTPVYGAILQYVAPAAIFLLLLEVNLRGLLQAGLPMLTMFFIGAAATVLGVLAGLWVSGAGAHLGQAAAPLGGMFTGTYIGGSVNFNALALHYRITHEGALYTGAVAVDNILTALWMVITIALPRLFGGGLDGERASGSLGDDVFTAEEDRAALDPLELGVLGLLTLGSVWVSNGMAALLAARGLHVPSIILVTTLALIAAQIPAIHALVGVRPLGMFAVYLFLAVIGALCNLGALGQIGSIAETLVLLAGTVILVHGVLTFTAARLLGIDWGVAAVASQANIGGSTSALALARSLGRRDLLLPGILVGSLGYALGTYAGFLVAAFLLRSGGV